MKENYMMIVLYKVLGRVTANMVSTSITRSIRLLALFAFLFAATGHSQTTDVWSQAGPGGEDDLEVYNALTPNGDGDNDMFVIRNIEKFPDNQVQIFNRWGVLVYEARGYGVDGKFFTGISEGTVTIQQNEELPVGTYYYVLEYVVDGQTKSRAGYLYINR